MKPGLAKYNPFRIVDDRIQKWIYRDLFYVIFFFVLLIAVSFLPDLSGIKFALQIILGLLVITYYLKTYDDMFIILGKPELRYNADEPMMIVGLLWCLLFGWGLLTLLVLIYFAFSGPKYQKWLKERQQLYEKQVNDLFDLLDAGDVTRSVDLIDEMGRMDNYLAIEPLDILLEDPDEAVKSHAARALLSINSKSSKRKMGRPANVTRVASAQSDKK